MLSAASATSRQVSERCYADDASGITGLITNIGFVNIVAADGFIGNNSATAVSTVASRCVNNRGLGGRREYRNDERHLQHAVVAAVASAGLRGFCNDEPLGPGKP